MVKEDQNEKFQQVIVGTILKPFSAFLRLMHVLRKYVNSKVGSGRVIKTYCKAPIIDL